MLCCCANTLYAMDTVNQPVIRIVARISSRQNTHWKETDMEFFLNLLASKWPLSLSISILIVMTWWLIVRRYEHVEAEYSTREISHRIQHEEPSDIAWMVGLGIALIIPFCLATFAFLLGGTIALYQTIFHNWIAHPCTLPQPGFWKCIPIWGRVSGYLNEGAFSLQFYESFVKWKRLVRRIKYEDRIGHTTSRKTWMADTSRARISFSGSFPY